MEILGINIPLAIAIGVMVMAVVNYYKSSYKTELPAWHLRIANMIVSFAIVYLIMLGATPVVWYVYAKTSVAVALLASGFWDGTSQIGSGIVKAISSAKVNVETSKAGESNVSVEITKDETK